MSETARYHVRALDRSLAILRMLNQHNGLVAAELSRLVDLPRPTVLRLLNTLSDAGYVMRSECDNRYRATRKLRELSCGYEEETWLRNVVQPFLAELEQELIAYCKDQLSTLKCPRSIDFEKELPRDITGKMMKRELRARYWEKAEAGA